MGYLIIDISGKKLTAEDQEILLHPSIAGIILFSRNYDTPQQLKSLTQHIRQLRPQFIIAVDQEGGRVQRFVEGFTRIPAMQYWGQLYDDNPQQAIAGLKNMATIILQELIAVGVNVNLVPVLDLNHGKSAIIGERSFHTNPQIIIQLSQLLIDVMHEEKMPAIGKHFPGHGAVVADSHTSLPVDNRPWLEIQQDLLPFAQLSQCLDGIMPAHILYTQIHTQPACFSAVWLRKILREQLQFQGVVISDDLSMAGAANQGSYAERVSRALDAGCDLLLLCNNRLGVLEVLNSKSIQLDAASTKRINHFLQKLR